MRFIDLSHVIEHRMITYPGLPGPQVGAQTLIDRGAVLVGIYSVNIDDTTTGYRPAHTVLLGAGIPVVEHLTRLADLPATGAVFTAVPPALRGLATSQCGLSPSWHYEQMTSTTESGQKSRRRAALVAASFLGLALALGGCGADSSDSGSGDSGSSAEAPAEGSASASADIEPDTANADHPDVLAAELESDDGSTWALSVTLSSQYDTPERYADGWRVLDADGEVLGEHTLTHDHANEQPVTRTQSGLEIPDGVDVVTVEGKDTENGYGGATLEVEVPR